MIKKAELFCLMYKHFSFAQATVECKAKKSQFNFLIVHHRRFVSAIITQIKNYLRKLSLQLRKRFPQI